MISQFRELISEDENISTEAIGNASKIKGAIKLEILTSFIALFLTK